MWAVMRLRTFRRSSRPRREPKKKKATQSQKQKKLEKHFGKKSPFKNPFLKRIYWLFRKCQYYICFYEDEIEEDDLDVEDPFSTRPPSLEELERCTGFNKKWLMFLYRNFKQHCSNGRMSDAQWREVVRLLFPCSADDRFADRLYKTITKDRGSDKIIFKDLVLCLWELTESGQSSGLHASSGTSSSTIAQFVFELMGPDSKGRVDEASFFEYVKCVYALSERKHPSVNIALGLPGSIYRAKSSDLDKFSSPLIRGYSREKFRSLDTDNDGYLRIGDIERELEKQRNHTLLQSVMDVTRNTPGTSKT